MAPKISKYRIIALNATPVFSQFSGGVFSFSISIKINNTIPHGEMLTLTEKQPRWHFILRKPFKKYSHFTKLIKFFSQSCAIYLCYLFENGLISPNIKHTKIIK